MVMNGSTNPILISSLSVKWTREEEEEGEEEEEEEEEEETDRPDLLPSPSYFGPCDFQNCW